MTLLQATESILRRLRAQESLTQDELLMVVGSSSYEDRVLLAKRTDCPPQAMMMLAVDDSQSVTCTLAENPACLPELISTFACGENWILRQRVAGNPSTSPDLLTVLASDEDKGVKTKVVGNPACPLPILLHSCNQGDASLRVTAKQTIQGTLPELWARRVADGISLSEPVSGCNLDLTLGDELLKHNLTKAYQIIQGLELDAKIRPQLAADVPMPISPPRARMRL